MSGTSDTINLGGRTLEKEAVDAANSFLLLKYPGLLNKSAGKIRKLTLSHADYTKRSEWWDAYYQFLADKKKKSVISLQPQNKWDRVVVTLRIRWYGSVIKKLSFMNAVSEAENCLDIVRKAIDRQKSINEEHWVVSFWSEAFGGADLAPLYQNCWKARNELDICKREFNKPQQTTNIGAGMEALYHAVFWINEIDRDLVRYRGGIEKGADRAIKGIEITISILAAVSGAGVAGKVVASASKARNLTLAAKFLEKHKIIRFLSETAIESGTKITLETGAKITTLVNSSEKVKWGEILKDQVLGSFIKDIISGGLSKIFVGRFLDKKVSLKWPSTSALCKEMGIESPVHNKKVTEYFIELINNMGAETLYQTVIKKLLVKSTGKPMTFSEFLDNLSTELIKFVITYPLAKSAKKSR